RCSQQLSRGIVDDHRGVRRPHNQVRRQPQLVGCVSMRLVKTPAVCAIAVAFLALIAGTGTVAVQPRPQPPKSPRLYVFDCGTLEGDPARFNFKREEMATTDMSVACYLVVHPKG